MISRGRNGFAFEKSEMISIICKLSSFQTRFPLPYSKNASISKYLKAFLLNKRNEANKKKDLKIVYIHIYFQINNKIALWKL